MRVLAAVVAAALVAVAPACADDVEVATFSPAAAVSLPFGCDWGYDWDERCYREQGVRLPVGGELDKVWRTAVRFPTLPSGASVLTAELSLWYDATCLGPRRTSRSCDGRGFTFGLHPILSRSWFTEREVEFGPQVGTAELAPLAEQQWVVWDVTDLVAEWTSGAMANDGALIKVADGQEDYGSGGPLFAGASHPNVSLRPRLTIWYLTE
jgi:hypothetical protein